MANTEISKLPKIGGICKASIKIQKSKMCNNIRSNDLDLFYIKDLKV